MSDFIVDKLTKSVGDKTVFRDISFIIHDLDRIGLIGVNGTGKTTLLDVLSGKSGFDGDVSPFSAKTGYKIAYLTQEPDFDEEQTVLDTVLSSDLREMQLIREYELLLTTYDESQQSRLEVGPVNKAAYVFGTSTLASTVSTGGSPVMAAVMAAGMVPPLAVFVATLFFKNKFTEEERNSGITNIVMGLSFITEGAIPFGAADPARAIPSFIVGSALTGALVGLSGIKLMAPHGGIFVIGLTNNPILYLVYVLIGAVVSGIIFGFLRKPLSK